MPELRLSSNAAPHILISKITLYHTAALRGESQKSPTSKISHFDEYHFWAIFETHGAERVVAEIEAVDLIFNPFDLKSSQKLKRSIFDFRLAGDMRS